MKRSIPFKSFAVLLAAVYGAVNCGGTTLSESNMWAERRRAARVRPGPLAALPASTDPRLVLKGLPDVRPALADAALGRLRAPNSFLRTHGDLLRAVPPSAGALRRVSLPAGGKPGPLVLLLQDVHRNDEAQANLGRMVEALAQAPEPVGVVGLEALFTPLHLEKYRSFPDQNAVRLTADYLLKQHEISGPVHAAYTFPGRLPDVVGVDDPAHYDANVAAYRRCAPVMLTAKRALALELSRLNEEKAASFNGALAAFDRQAEAYRRGSLPFGAYAETLAAAAPAGEALAAFLGALKMEKALDFKTVETERARWIEGLVKKLDKTRLEQVTALSLAYRAGDLSHTAYYAALKDLCGRSGMDLAQYPAMDAYLRYVVLAGKIEAEKLFEDVRRAETAAYSRLALSGREKKLVAESRRLLLAARLLSFSLTPSEWDEYQRMPRPSESTTGGAELVSFEAFYREADARSHAMADNLLAAMEARKTPTAALVAGGFHTAAMARLLTERGAAVVEIAPQLTRVDGTASDYLNVFTREKTPLELMFKGDRLFLGEKANKAGETGSFRVITVMTRKFFNPSADPQADLRIFGDGSLENVVTGDGRISTTSTAPGMKPLRFMLSFKDGAIADFVSAEIVTPFRKWVKTAIDGVKLGTSFAGSLQTSGSLLSMGTASPAGLFGSLRDLIPRGPDFGRAAPLAVAFLLAALRTHANYGREEFSSNPDPAIGFFAFLAIAGFFIYSFWRMLSSEKPKPARFLGDHIPIPFVGVLLAVFGIFVETPNKGPVMLAIATVTIFIMASPRMKAWIILLAVLYFIFTAGGDGAGGGHSFLDLLSPSRALARESGESDSSKGATALAVVGVVVIGLLLALISGMRRPPEGGPVQVSKNGVGWGALFMIFVALWAIYETFFSAALLGLPDLSLISKVQAQAASVGDGAVAAEVLQPRPGEVRAAAIGNLIFLGFAPFLLVVLPEVAVLLALKFAPRLLKPFQELLDDIEDGAALVDADPAKKAGQYGIRSKWNPRLSVLILNFLEKRLWIYSYSAALMALTAAIAIFPNAGILNFAFLAVLGFAVFWNGPMVMFLSLMLSAFFMMLTAIAASSGLPDFFSSLSPPSGVFAWAGGLSSIPRAHAWDGSQSTSLLTGLPEFAVLMSLALAAIWATKRFLPRAAALVRWSTAAWGRGVWSLGFRSPASRAPGALSLLVPAVLLNQGSNDFFVYLVLLVVGVLVVKAVLSVLFDGFSRLPGVRDESDQDARMGFCGCVTLLCFVMAGVWVTWALFFCAPLMLIPSLPDLFAGPKVQAQPLDLSGSQAATWFSGQPENAALMVLSLALVWAARRFLPRTTLLLLKRAISRTRPAAVYAAAPLLLLIFPVSIAHAQSGDLSFLLNPTLWKWALAVGVVVLIWNLINTPSGGPSEEEAGSGDEDESTATWDIGGVFIITAAAGLIWAPTGAALIMMFVVPTVYAAFTRGGPFIGFIVLFVDIAIVWLVHTLLYGSGESSALETPWPRNGPIESFAGVAVLFIILRAAERIPAWVRGWLKERPLSRRRTTPLLKRAILKLSLAAVYAFPLLLLLTSPTRADGVVDDAYSWVYNLSGIKVAGLGAALLVLTVLAAVFLAFRRLSARAAQAIENGSSSTWKERFWYLYENDESFHFYVRIFANTALAAAVLALNSIPFLSSYPGWLLIPQTAAAFIIISQGPMIFVPVGLIASAFYWILKAVPFGHSLISLASAQDGLLGTRAASDLPDLIALALLFLWLLFALIETAPRLTAFGRRSGGPRDGEVPGWNVAHRAALALRGAVSRASGALTAPAGRLITGFQSPFLKKARDIAVTVGLPLFIYAYASPVQADGKKSPSWFEILMNTIYAILFVLLIVLLVVFLAPVLAIIAIILFLIYLFFLEVFKKDLLDFFKDDNDKGSLLEPLSPVSKAFAQGAHPAVSAGHWSAPLHALLASALVFLPALGLSLVLRSRIGNRPAGSAPADRAAPRPQTPSPRLKALFSLPFIFIPFLLMISTVLLSPLARAGAWDGVLMASAASGLPEAAFLLSLSLGISVLLRRPASRALSALRTFAGRFSVRAWRPDLQRKFYLFVGTALPLLLYANSAMAGKKEEQSILRTIFGIIITAVLIFFAVILFWWAFIIFVILLGLYYLWVNRDKGRDSDDEDSFLGPFSPVSKALARNANPAAMGHGSVPEAFSNPLVLTSILILMLMARVHMVRRWTGGPGLRIGLPPGILGLPAAVKAWAFRTKDRLYKLSSSAPPYWSAGQKARTVLWLTAVLPAVFGMQNDSGLSREKQIVLFVASIFFVVGVIMVCIYAWKVLVPVLAFFLLLYFLFSLGGAGDSLLRPLLENRAMAWNGERASPALQGFDWVFYGTFETALAWMLLKAPAFVSSGAGRLKGLWEDRTAASEPALLISRIFRRTSGLFMAIPRAFSRLPAGGLKTSWPALLLITATSFLITAPALARAAGSSGMSTELKIILLVLIVALVFLIAYVIKEVPGVGLLLLLLIAIAFYFGLRSGRHSSLTVPSPISRALAEGPGAAGQIPVDLFHWLPETAAVALFLFAAAGLKPIYAGMKTGLLAFWNGAGTKTAENMKVLAEDVFPPLETLKNSFRGFTDDVLPRVGGLLGRSRMNRRAAGLLTAGALAFSVNGMPMKASAAETIAGEPLSMDIMHMPAPGRAGEPVLDEAALLRLVKGSAFVWSHEFREGLREGVERGQADLNGPAPLPRSSEEESLAYATTLVENLAGTRMDALPAAASGESFAAWAVVSRIEDMDPLMDKLLSRHPEAPGHLLIFGGDGVMGETVRRMLYEKGLSRLALDFRAGLPEGPQASNTFFWKPAREWLEDLGKTGAVTRGTTLVYEAYPRDMKLALDAEPPSWLFEWKVERYRYSLEGLLKIEYLNLKGAINLIKLIAKMA